MAEIVRSWSGAGLIARAGEADERIVEGIVAPYGQPATVQDVPGGPRYRETIARGAFGQVDPARVRLESGAGLEPGRLHEGARLIGRGIAADDRPEGLWMAFRIARTPAGDEAYELAREGVLGDFSIRGRPVSERRLRDGTVERTGVDLRRVAILEDGAYDGAAITAVRAAAEGNMPANQRPPAATGDEDPAAEAEGEQTPATPAPAGSDRPNRTRVTTQVDVERAALLDRQELERRRFDEGADIGELVRSAPIRITRAEAIYGPSSPHSFLHDGWMASRGDGAAFERYSRHQAHMADLASALERAASWDGIQLARAGDVLSSEIPGAYPNDYLPGLLTPRIFKGRPMGSFYDRFPIADARPRIFPKATTATVVAVQSAEGAALSSTDFATTAVTATPLMYGAYTDVSRQSLDGADPAAQQMILQDLIEAYSQASEAVIKTAVEAGSTASGVAITAATPYAGVLANVVNYQGVRFNPAEGAFIPSALYSVLLAQGDSTGRPFLPMIGQVNSDGSVQRGGIQADVLGASTYLSWASTVNVCVFGRPSDFVIFESSIAQFSYDQVVGPQAVRIGIWAYLVVGARLGSLKVTAA